MDEKVISLQERRDSKKPSFCFTCPCGNQLFVLRPDARIECGHCSEIQDRLLWGQYFVSATYETTTIPSSADSASTNESISNRGE